MRFRNTLIVLLILAALATYVYFVEIRGGREEATPTPSAAAVVWDLDVASVVDLTVEGTEGHVHLSRPPGGLWQMKEPTEEEADDDRINSQLTAVAKLTATRVITGVSELADFGLATPAWQITLGLQDGSSESLLVGDKNPQKTAFYAQRPGEEGIYLLPAYKLDNLIRLATELPYKPTPTPSSTGEPTARPNTATPTPETTPTPTLEATATPGS